MAGGQTERMVPLVSVCMWVVLLCGLVNTVRSCSPTEPEPLVQRVHMADVVIHGIVEKTYEDGMFDYGAGSAVYTAKMLVYCMYKGPRGAVPMYINVTQAGSVPGHCFSTHLEKGSSYIVLLRRTDGVTLKPADSQLEPTQENKDEVMKACNVNVQYPSGAIVNNYKDEEKCPTPAAQCIPNNRGDVEFVNEPADHDHVDDAYLPPGHTHADHHAPDGDDHQHDHNHDGKHDHDDHHLGHEHDEHESEADHEDAHHGDEDDAKDDGKKDTEGKDGQTGAVVGGDDDDKNSSCTLHSSILLSIILSITTVVTFRSL